MKNDPNKTMIGFRIKAGFIDLAKTDFNCPYCDKKYNDDDDKYSDRCDKSETSRTFINCDCGNRFGMTYEITGEAIGFKINEICECDAPLVRADVSGGEYCGDCGFDIKK